MTTKAGTGFSEKANSRDAAIEAASLAMTRAGIDRCDVVLMFGTSKHDPRLLREGVREIVGPEARLIGGAAVGVITNDRMGYEGSQFGVAVLASDSIRMDLFKERGLADREYEAGASLGRRIRSQSYEGEENLFFMYDLVKSSSPGAGVGLNVPTPLLRGLQDSLGTWPSTAGLGMVGSFQFTPGFHWFDDEIEGRLPEEQSALALMMSGPVRMETMILHGMRPSTGYHTITKSDGNVVLEVDGRPAVDLVEEMFGGGATEAGWDDFPIFTVFGLNKGEKFQDFREDDYTVRMCQAIDRKRGGLVVVADDLIPGTDFQFMRRSIQFDYIAPRVDELLKRANGRRPFFALYVDCAARAGAFSGTDQEEAHEIQAALGPHIPLLGMYSGVEIARVGTEIVQNNMTGVLCLFTETGPA